MTGLAFATAAVLMLAGTATFIGCLIIWIADGDADEFIEDVKKHMAEAGERWSYF